MSNSYVSGVDGFIIKYNSSGEFVWGRYISGTGADQGLGVTTDSTGVYVSGYCGAALTNIGGAMTNSYVNGQEGFIIKYNSSGTFVWGRYIGGTSSEQGLGVATDSNGVYVTGYCNAVLTNVGDMSNSYVGASDGFILKYDSSGTFVWGRYISASSGSSSDQGMGVATDSTGVYVTGFCGGALTNTGGAMSNSYVGNDDGFIIKYNSSGLFSWGRYISSSGSVSDRGLGVATDSTGVYVTGYCSASLINAGTMSNSYVGGNDGFIIKYTSSGTFVWGNYIGSSSTSNDRSLGVATDSNGVYVTGFCLSSLTNTGGTMLNSIRGGIDGFIIKYNSSGTFVWGRYIAGTTVSAIDQCLGVAANSTGVYVTGYCASGLTDMGGTMSNSYVSSQDGFIIKYV
jgi:hypothetical protein